MNILLYANSQKDEGLKNTLSIASILRQRGVDLYLFGGDAENIAPFENADKIDYVIAVGGDGTFLRASKIAYKHDAPLIGVNLGRLGFMPSLEIGDCGQLEKLFDESYEVEERSVLDISYTFGGLTAECGMCLNDAILRTGSSGRILDLDLYCDGQLVNKYRADGIVVSTPTGSSAYSLSCGGPIVAPTVNCILATPVSAHTLSSRPLVFDINAEINVSVSNLDDRDASLILDGEKGIDFAAGSVLKIKTASKKLKVIRLNSMTYYELLSKKLKF